MNENTAFHYTYSAAQNSEIREIRRKYLPPEENKLELLRSLDKRVKSAGQIPSLTVGVLGCLIFGCGMCFGMQILGSSVLLGILLGLIGALVMTAAYPVYRLFARHARKELVPRILALTDELMGNEP